MVNAGGGCQRFRHRCLDRLGGDDVPLSRKKSLRVAAFAAVGNARVCDCLCLHGFSGIRGTRPGVDAHDLWLADRKGLLLSRNPFLGWRHYDDGARSLPVCLSPCPVCVP